MNILDAIRSGKRFYRASWSNRMPIGFEDVRKLSQSAMLAEDWEIERVEVTISANDFEQACDRVNDSLYKLPGDQVHISDYLDELKKELGL